MSPLDVADNKVADPHDGTVAYVPPLERTAGQPEPIAAHGGLSYMAFARDGDAGTAKALEDALAEIAEGEGQGVADMIANAPPGSLFPAGAARCAADRRVLPWPFAEQPGMHGQARRVAGASRVQMHKHLRCGGGGTRLLPRDREIAARILPGRDRRIGL